MKKSQAQARGNPDNNTPAAAASGSNDTSSEVNKGSKKQAVPIPAESAAPAEPGDDDNGDEEDFELFGPTNPDKNPSAEDSSKKGSVLTTESGSVTISSTHLTF